MQTAEPQLSIVIVVYNMRRQAMNTLASLSAAYQQGVSAQDYEVLVMENDSGHNLDPTEVAALGSNFHYRLRREPGVSPAPAINEALALARGDYVGLVIDGARMLTPGVLRWVIQARLMPGAVVMVPGYYLTEQGKTLHGSGELEPADILGHEKALLEASNWRDDGYRLFRRACFSNGNRHGFLEPVMECNALFCSRSLLRDIGGADEQFNLSGGGALNLHLYRQLATAAHTRLVTLPGEGNFHQYHGGTSTTPGEERDALVKTFKTQLDRLWPGGFKAVSRPPVLLGTVGPYAMRFLQQSAESAQRRLDRFEREGRNPWEDEP